MNGMILKTYILTYYDEIKKSRGLFGALISYEKFHEILEEELALVENKYFINQ